ncbi:MAG: alanine:cation symporter family protein [Bifidobacteriaceae bacterium]|jgi:AGCS family alanine or glycine:cation symporter|nr:alanine:cation symporter family protein [Bifidobacteriaceae bacterium]
MRILDWVSDVLGASQAWLFTWLIIPALVVAGVVFTILGRGAQLRLFVAAIRTMLEKASAGTAMSPFQALMISTASRVGVGNIAGVATAIAMGGPGAVFWMWVMALFGGASALVESTLAQVYKRRDGGAFRGGPSYYIQRALKQRWLGVTFAVCLIACYAYGFNALQANNTVAALDAYLPDQTATHLLVAALLAGLTAAVIFGGQKTISLVTSTLVPLMAAIYLALGAIVTVTHLGDLGPMFATIWEGATDWRTIFGGFAGSAVMWGVKRGLYSNEAGMGSAPNAAAAADTSHPVKQGLVQMLSVFIDTMLICSTSAFIILLSGVKTTGQEAMPLVQSAIRRQFGEGGVLVLTVAVCLFAFSSIIGNYYYTESNMFFIRGDSKLRVFKATAVLAVFWGSLAGYDLVWNLADFLMALMTIINIVAIVLLAPRARRVIADFYRQLKEGRDPVFIAANAGITDADWWTEGRVFIGSAPTAGSRS